VRNHSLATDHLRLRVVIAGDCSAALALMARDPEYPEFPVFAVESAADVADRLDELAADLILIDADCEQPDGIELCRALKENPATIMIPLVVVSRSAKRRLTAFAAGADDFIVMRNAPRLAFLARVEALVRAGASRRKLASAQLAVEIRRHEQIRQTFRRYLSPRLADKILSDVELRDSILSGADVRSHATVLFADMRGFTGISERLNPQQVVPLLNEYFSLLTEITFQHEGTVFHMAGDCLMVGFGVPLEQSDSPERAVRAGRQMLDRFAVLADEWKRRHEIETGLGIGINEGDVIAGNVGSAAYMNYTIIGDTVNVASRLSQRARAGEMLFSSTVKRSLDARGYFVGAQELPPMMLRGRQNPIDIYCVPLDERVHVSPELEVSP